ncbi:hypothetical protein H5410_012955 [Solanum commersonii]|uniref:Uncharacterized protein n=1 Tax=Solanum commersonii TaxID=4109 RepID=A0A9J6ATT3_SOLCO|nr:hypothetical protein H5410_012955 [Solanum commersonii]
MRVRASGFSIEVSGRPTKPPACLSLAKAVGSVVPRDLRLEAQRRGCCRAYEAQGCLQGALWHTGGGCLEPQAERKAGAWGAQTTSKSEVEGTRGGRYGWGDRVLLVELYLEAGDEWLGGSPRGALAGGSPSAGSEAGLRAGASVAQRCGPRGGMWRGGPHVQMPQELVYYRKHSEPIVQQPEEQKMTI